MEDLSKPLRLHSGHRIVARHSSGSIIAGHSGRLLAGFDTDSVLGFFLGVFICHHRSEFGMEPNGCIYHRIVHIVEIGIAISDSDPDTFSSNDGFSSSSSDCKPSCEADDI